MYEISFITISIHSKQTSWASMHFIHWGSFPFLISPSPFLFALLSHSPPRSLSSPLLIHPGRLGERCKLPQRVWVESGHQTHFGGRTFRGKYEAFQGTDFLYFYQTELKGTDFFYDGTNHTIMLTKIVHRTRDCVGVIGPGYNTLMDPCRACRSNIGGPDPCGIDAYGRHVLPLTTTPHSDAVSSLKLFH